VLIVVAALGARWKWKRVTVAAPHAGGRDGLAST